jgi:tetratricopeptide (TPR) repeat protein
MGEYSEALSFCKKAVALREKTLPLDHLDFATTYNNIGLVYYLMEDYSKALSFFERTLDIWQYSLPSNHPNIKAVQEMIEDIKEEVEDNFF